MRMFLGRNCRVLYLKHSKVNQGKYLASEALPVCQTSHRFQAVIKYYILYSRSICERVHQVTSHAVYILPPPPGTVLTSHW